jgi:phosphomannomutase
MTPSIFKAYDIRGRYPEEINEEAVAEIARVLRKYFRRGKIIVGHDARLSSPQLYRAALSGITNKELGIKNLGKRPVIHNSKFIIHAVGMITTPMLYFLVVKLNAAGGIMITASHNPKEYNGLKIVGPNAVMISGKEIWEFMKISQ